jgi:hypothetical protein
MLFGLYTALDTPQVYCERTDHVSIAFTSDHFHIKRVITFVTKYSFGIVLLWETVSNKSCKHSKNIHYKIFTEKKILKNQ